MKLRELVPLDLFPADWTQDFRSQITGETYYTSGPHWWDGIPERAADARDVAHEYSHDVRMSQETARAWAREARRALKDGDTEAAIAALERAADYEREFGDSPHYGSAIKDLREAIEKEESNHEQP